jgi:hypothetical protein
MRVGPVGKENRSMTENNWQYRQFLSETSMLKSPNSKKLEYNEILSNVRFKLYNKWSGRWRGPVQKLNPSLDNTKLIQTDKNSCKFGPLERTEVIQLRDINSLPCLEVNKVVAFNGHFLFYYHQVISPQHSKYQARTESSLTSNYLGWGWGFWHCNIRQWTH